MDKSNQCIGKCALCDQENVVLKESHSIPKFIYQWIKDTSPTPYLRHSDDVNERLQDGPKEYLLCGTCEGKLSTTETEFAEQLFKKLANYRTQPFEILVTESMRICVLSIFWRALLTSLSRDNNRIDEDKQSIDKFLADAKFQINQNKVTLPIFIAPFHGEPPFFNLPKHLVYFLDRLAGAQDIRFFDNPHRYYIVFKLPFMFFYIPSDGWEVELSDSGKFTDIIRFDDIKEIPDFLREYIFWLADQFESSKNMMNQENIKKIKKDFSKNKKITGSHKSIKRSM